MVAMTSITIPDPDQRGDLGAFVARVVRLDPAAPVRLRRRAGDGLGMSGPVTVWAVTPFDALVTRTVHGGMEPADLTATATGLLTALTVDRAETVDPGPSCPWPAPLPPDAGWTAVDDVPVVELERLTDRGLMVARENAGPHGPPAALLDQVVLTVSADGSGAAPPVKVPMRCLFALSGMGFLGPSDAADRGVVRVSAASGWLRLDARYGAVVRRRITVLPLLVAGAG